MYHIILLDWTGLELRNGRVIGGEGGMSASQPWRILGRRVFDGRDFYTVGNELMIFDLINLKKRRSYVD